jgi:hypothetical protein
MTGRARADNQRIEEYSSRRPSLCRSRYGCTFKLRVRPPRSNLCSWKVAKSVGRRKRFRAQTTRREMSNLVPAVQQRSTATVPHRIDHMRPPFELPGWTSRHLIVRFWPVQLSRRPCEPRIFVAGALLAFDDKSPFSLNPSADPRQIQKQVIDGLVERMLRRRDRQPPRPLGFRSKKTPGSVALPWTSQLDSRQLGFARGLLLQGLFLVWRSTRRRLGGPGCEYYLQFLLP